MDFEKSLIENCWELVIDEPFYGLFLTELNKRFVEKDHPIQTACVAKSPGDVSVSLMINKHFWEHVLKNDKQRKFVILHEALHVIFNHFLFFHTRTDRLMDNIATDICINQYCEHKFERPEDGMFLDKFPELKLKPLESSEYYYDELCKARDKKAQSSSKGQDSQFGPKGNGNGTSGSKTLDQMIDTQPQDWHATWGEITEGMSDTEKELLKRQIEASLRDVAEQVEKSRGEIPAHLKDLINKAFQVNKPIVEWKTIFRQFIGSAMAYDPYRTRKRPNLRFDEAPTTRNKPKIRGAFGIDQSGSMGENDIAEGNSELYHIWKSGVKIDLFEWD